MKHCALCLLLVLSGLPFRLAAADKPVPLAPTVVRALPLLPATGWRVETDGTSQATLSEIEGFLQVAFDVEISAKRAIGHITLPEASVRLVLEKPVALSPEERRVLFDAYGVSDSIPGSAIKTNVSVKPFLLFEDEHGERFSFWPYPYPHLQEGGSRWAKWYCRDIRSSEAGGATQEIFDATGGDGNARPDGVLRFLGFDLRVRAGEDKTGRHQGKVVFGSVDTGRSLLAYEDPFGFTSSFMPADTKAAGEYALAVTVRDEFQGRPVGEFKRPFTYDPASLASQRQRITFPLGPDGNYWIDYQINDSAGRLVNDGQIRATALQNPATEALVPVDLTKEPVTGMMRVNPGKNSNGVYAERDLFQAVIRIFPKGTPLVTLEWQQLEYGFDTVIAQGTQTVDFGQAPFRDVTVPLTRAAGRDAYRLRVTLLDAAKEDRRLRDEAALPDAQRKQAQAQRQDLAKKGALLPNTLDRLVYYLGKVTALEVAYNPRQGIKRRDRHAVIQESYFRFSFELHNGALDENHLLRKFAAFLEQVQPVTRDVSYQIDIRDFEVLPGVYDFAPVDRIMDAAADQGCSVTIRLDHADQSGRNLYRWLHYTRQRNFDNAEAGGHSWYGGFSLADDEFLQVYLRAFRAFYSRYKAHPAFQGYYLMNIGGEWAVLDQPWRGLFGGYEKPMEAAFRRYLKESLGLSLEQLNKRWSTTLASWDEVLPPQPDFSTGKLPDLRMSYYDFCRFKHWMDTNYWYQRAATDIRTYDPDGVIIAYGWSPNGLEGKVDYLHNGGNHYGGGFGDLFHAWDNKLGWITEPHHPQLWAAYGDPGGGGWVLDWSTYIMLGQAGGGGANLHIYFNPRHDHQEDYFLPAFFGGNAAYDRFWRFRVILHELQHAKMVADDIQIATLQDPSTLFCKHRSTFASRLKDLGRWFELIEADGLRSETFRDDQEARYKLILPNPLDEVMSLDTIEHLNRMVRGGKKMIIAANTGKYCPEAGRDASFVLLRKLGIDPPQGEYAQAGLNVAAEVVADNPLFAKGAPIRFFTFEELRRSYRDLDFGNEGYMRWPYCWIPMTDYFGWYKDNRQTNGEVWAKFSNGAVALSRHKVGDGEVVVFWGTPDYQKRLMRGFMNRAAAWAAVPTPSKDNPIPLMMEAYSDVLKRHYAIMYHETPGEYRMVFPAVPNGDYFLEEIVSDCKLGYYTGKELRETGVLVKYYPGYSPLKVIRMSPETNNWGAKYRALTDPPARVGGAPSAKEGEK